MPPLHSIETHSTLLPERKRLNSWFTKTAFLWVHSIATNSRIKWNNHHDLRDWDFFVYKSALRGRERGRLSTDGFGLNAKMSVCLTRLLHKRSPQTINMRQTSQTQNSASPQGYPDRRLSLSLSCVLSLPLSLSSLTRYLSSLSPFLAPPLFLSLILFYFLSLFLSLLLSLSFTLSFLSLSLSLSLSLFFFLLLSFSCHECPLHLVLGAKVCWTPPHNMVQILTRTECTYKQEPASDTCALVLTPTPALASVLDRRTWSAVGCLGTLCSLFPVNITIANY